MKTIRAIHGKTLRDKIRSDQLRQLGGIQDIIKWADVRRKEWDAHVERTEDNRLAKIARDNRPPRKAEETLEGKSQRSFLTLNSGRTGVSLQRSLIRRCEPHCDTVLVSELDFLLT
jgi:hypothetical protein